MATQFQHSCPGNSGVEEEPESCLELELNYIVLVQSFDMDSSKRADEPKKLLMTTLCRSREGRVQANAVCPPRPGGSRQDKARQFTDHSWPWFPYCL